MTQLNLSDAFFFRLGCILTHLTPIYDSSELSYKLRIVYFCRSPINAHLYLLDSGSCMMCQNCPVSFAIWIENMSLISMEAVGGQHHSGVSGFVLFFCGPTNAHVYLLDSDSCTTCQNDLNHVITLMTWILNGSTSTVSITKKLYSHQVLGGTA
jgi:hypothetical protein